MSIPPITPSRFANQNSSNTLKPKRPTDLPQASKATIPTKTPTTPVSTPLPPSLSPALFVPVEPAPVVPFAVVPFVESSLPLQQYLLKHPSHAVVRSSPNLPLALSTTAHARHVDHSGSAEPFAEGKPREVRETVASRIASDWESGYWRRVVEVLVVPVGSALGR